MNVLFYGLLNNVLCFDYKSQLSCRKKTQLSFLKAQLSFFESANVLSKSANVLRPIQIYNSYCFLYIRTYIKNTVSYKYMQGSDNFVVKFIYL